MKNWVAAAVLGAAMTTSIGPSAAAEESATCGPQGARTLLENKVARVYQYRRGNEAKGACVFSLGDRRYPLDAPRISIEAFGPPAIGLAGTILGSSSENCGADEAPCETDIVVDDLLGAIDHDRPQLHRFANAGITRRAVKVGSLRVRQSGGVAWITCPERFRYTFTATQRPNCKRAGAYDYVVKLDADTKRRRVLDRGRQIDPSSLRIRGNRISWRHGARRRHAALR
jgi:hypothetical protein